MRVHSATLAGGDNNQDRLFVTDDAVILLDGASAFEPVDVDAGLYAETLGAAITEELDQHPAIAIADAVATGIRHASRKLDLMAGRSPSSTVSVLRAGPHGVDLYALGDSPIYFGTQDVDHVLVDDRLSAVAIPERERYVSQLHAGGGYSAEHRAAMVELQRAQRQARNRPGGYWIAESDPDAAHHGLTTTIPAEAITWAVLATDGAADIIDHIGPSWTKITKHDCGELATLLQRLHIWETTADPDGSQLSRAKQHDDKTVAVARIRET